MAGGAPSKGSSVAPFGSLTAFATASLIRISWALAVSSPSLPIIGTTPEYVTVRSSPIAQGDFVSQSDVERRALSMVLGSTLAEQLFPNGDALGQQVRLALGGNLGFNFRVIGVMAPRGGSTDQDLQVYVPVSTMQSRLPFTRNATGEIAVTQISIQTAPKVDQAAVKAEITNLLVSRHAVATPDFLVQSQNDLLGAASEVSATLSILLGSVAGISLLVGGIGVMAIMMVSVTARTREIGVRMALGAQPGQVLSMVMRAQPFPPFPAGMNQASVHLSVPVRFSLR